MPYVFNYQIGSNHFITYFCKQRQLLINKGNIYFLYANNQLFAYML